MKFTRIYMPDKKGAIQYFELLKRFGVKFKLRPYAKGFAFIFSENEEDK